MDSPFCEEFVIPEELVGLAIGSHGSNIQAARDIHGVTSIEYDMETLTFRVSEALLTVLPHQ